MSLRNWCITLFLGLGLLLPMSAGAQDKPDAKKDDPAAKKDADKKEPAKGDKKPDDKKPGMKMEDKEEKKEKEEPKEKKPQYREVGRLTGRITQIGEGGTTLTVRVTGVTPTWVRTYDYRFGRWRTNPDYRNPQVNNQDYDVILADDAKVRIPPKREVDEKGKPKPPPKKDPKEDPDYKLPGYKGEVSDLAKDQMVTVVFGQSTDPKRPEIVATLVLVQQDAPGFKRGDDR